MAMDLCLFLLVSLEVVTLTSLHLQIFFQLVILLQVAIACLVESSFLVQTVWHHDLAWWANLCFQVYRNVLATSLWYTFHQVKFDRIWVATSWIVDPDLLLHLGCLVPFRVEVDLFNQSTYRRLLQRAYRKDWRLLR